MCGEIAVFYVTLRCMNRLLVMTRRIVSGAIFLIVTGALVSAQLVVPYLAEWLEKVQFMQAVMAEALVVFVCWLIITLIFGRVYCSTVCPLGTLQDVASRLMRTTIEATERRRYRFRRPANGVRYTALVAVLICLMGGYVALPMLMDPYAVWVRFCRLCMAPLLHSEANGAITPWDTAAVRIITGTLAGTAVALLTVVAVCVAAARRGRIVCNTICPVGTTLGFISRYAIMQIDIDTDRCTQCRRCVDVCKAECIDITDHVVDGSRCVNCFDCLEACQDNAIRYTARRKQLSIPMMQSVKNLSPGQSTAVTELTTTEEIQKNDETIS